MKVDVSRGAIVQVGERLFKITDNALAFDQVEARDIETGRLERLSIGSLTVPRIEESAEIAAPDLSTLDSADVEEARRRLNVIRPLLQLSRRTRADIDAAVAALGVGKTTLYRWMNNYAVDGRLTSLMPVKRPGGRGKSRLDPVVEGILQTTIDQQHMKPLQVTVRSTVREVKRRCRNAGIRAPHENTIRARIAAIPEKTRLKKRGQSKRASDRFTPRPDHYGEATHPLAVVQMDHTVLDVVLVDERYRLPLRRPYLTLAMDVYSRMVVGFYVSFDNPGAFGTGLCIARSIALKNTWLAKIGVKNEWPCWGFPARIHVDNAKEFRGEMLRLACEQYKIGIDFRPIAVPSTGGHIERLLGTVTLKRIRDIAGSARKPSERGDYDPEEQAIMTLPELEQTLAEFITGAYHREFHEGIGTTPLKRWTDAIMGDGERPGSGVFPPPEDEERLFIDFMPVEKRTVQTYGVQIDDVFYYSDTLRPFVKASRSGSNRFVFHRDPRDISVIYFWDPDLQQYSTVPYRNSTHPPISIWELRAVRKHLVDQGRAAVDENAIFETYNRLREHEERAKTQTREVRRKHERKAALVREKAQRPIAVSKVVQLPTTRRFSNIEPLEMEEEV